MAQPPGWATDILHRHNKWIVPYKDGLVAQIAEREREIRRLRKRSKPAAQAGPGTTKRVLESLTRLHDKKAIVKVYFDEAASTFNFLTSDIKIPKCKVNFGKFQITVSLELDWVKATPVERNKEIAGHYHPHISRDGIVCLGDVYYTKEDGSPDGSEPLIDAIHKAAWKGKYDEVCLFVLGALRAYNKKDPHLKVTAWDPTCQLDERICMVCLKGISQCPCYKCVACNGTVRKVCRAEHCDPCHRKSCATCRGCRRCVSGDAFFCRQCGSCEECHKSQLCTCCEKEHKTQRQFCNTCLLNNKCQSCAGVHKEVDVSKALVHCNGCKKHFRCLGCEEYSQTGLDYRGLCKGCETHTCPGCGHKGERLKKGIYFCTPCTISMKDLSKTLYMLSKNQTEEVNSDRPPR